MKLITSPEKFIPDGKFTVFLAGSIEMGKAVDWQADFIDTFSQYDLNILNPRRQLWDPDWIQSRDNLEFVSQVQWELYGLEMADLIVMYLQPGTISPVSMLELGLFARTGKLLVCCPAEFQRSGNIDIVCEQYRIRYCTDMNDFYKMAENRIRQHVNPVL
jgi:hypothetical protein